MLWVCEANKQTTHQKKKRKIKRKQRLSELTIKNYSVKPERTLLLGEMLKLVQLALLSLIKVLTGSLTRQNQSWNIHIQLTCKTICFKKMKIIKSSLPISWDLCSQKSSSRWIEMIWRNSCLLPSWWGWNLRLLRWNEDSLSLSLSLSLSHTHTHICFESFKCFTLLLFLFLHFTFCF